MAYLKPTAKEVVMSNWRSFPWEAFCRKMENREETVRYDYGMTRFA